MFTGIAIARGGPVTLSFRLSSREFGDVEYVSTIVDSPLVKFPMI